MNRISLSALAVLVIVCPALAQKPISPPPAPNPPSRNQIKSNQYEVVVKGCISNGRLQKPVRLKVASLTHFNEGCVARH